MSNELKGGIDKMVWMRVFEEMTPVQRRWAFISVKMAEYQKTFKDIARRHRLGAGYLAECVQGVIKNGHVRNLTNKMKNALESELKIDLTYFLSPAESWKIMAKKNMAWVKSKQAPKEEAI